MYAVQFILEWPDTIGRNQMSQIVDMFLEEITFGSLHLQVSGF